MSAPVPVAAELAAVFEEQRSLLWGLGYRLTGSAADADDVVQETFVRAIERPPKRTDQPWRPWLVRVAVNVGRDLLRRRRRRRYVGPWLPSPIDTGEEATLPAVEANLASGESTEGRYDLLESVSYAFLLALEALTPRQRAVLLLRDVFDYSVRETAFTLDASEASIKTMHHRARRSMREYDTERTIPTRALQARTRTALERFVQALRAKDGRALEALLARSARALTDGGGEFLAARRPVIGASKVARFYVGLAAWHESSRVTFEHRTLNGLPAFVLRIEGAGPRVAPVSVGRIELDAAGRIRELHAILASRKLTALT